MDSAIRGTLGVVSFIARLSHSLKFLNSTPPLHLTHKSYFVLSVVLRNVSKRKTVSLKLTLGFGTLGIFLSSGSLLGLDTLLELGSLFLFDLLLALIALCSSLSTFELF